MEGREDGGVRMRRMIAGGLGTLAVLLAISGCQALFTTSPFSFLQRDVDNLPLAQQVTYAEDALAGGDEAAMAASYAAIEEEALAPGADPELTYLAAQLAMELSGAPDLVYQVMDNQVDFSDSTTLDTFMDSVDGAYVSAAADLFVLMQDDDLEVLTVTDLLLGAGCLLFQAADAEGGGDVSALTTTDVEPALDFSNAGLAELTARGIAAGDPAYDLLQELADYLGGI